MVNIFSTADQMILVATSQLYHVIHKKWWGMNEYSYVPIKNWFIEASGWLWFSWYLCRISLKDKETDKRDCDISNDLWGPGGTQALTWPPRLLPSLFALTLRGTTCLCAVCKKLGELKSIDWVHFQWCLGLQAFVFWALPSAGPGLRGESCFRCADWLPDVLGADSGRRRTLLLSISPGPHFIGKHGSCRRTETFSSSPLPPLPPP